MVKCLFCNDTVKTKTKEHIVPKWLLKLTDNDSGRRAYLQEKRWIPFNNYTFPACRSCNEKYSNLEDKSREIFEKLFSNKPVDNHEMIILLDWFDKVRVGLWYGELIMNNRVGIAPRFGIDNRMGKKDRVLVISKVNKIEKGINIYGTDFSGFTTVPSYFGLRVNNLLFLNYSDDFIVSKKLGLPYIEGFNSKNGKTNLMEIENEQINAGSKFIEKRIIDFPFTKNCTVIAQPIIQKDLKGTGKYDTEYVDKIFPDKHLGPGHVFFKNYDKDMKMITNQNVCIVPETIVDFRHTLKRLTISLAKYQKKALINELDNFSKVELSDNQRDAFMINSKIFIKEVDDVINGRKIYLQDHEPLI